MRVVYFESCMQIDWEKIYIIGRELRSRNESLRERLMLETDLHTSK